MFVSDWASGGCFCSVGGCCYSRWWLWDLRTLAISKEVKCLQVCSNILWFLYLVLLKEIRTWGQSNISSCCKSGELGGRGSPRFSCVTPVVESFSSYFLRAIISYREKSHLESCQVSTIKLLGKNSQRSQHVDYFRRKWPYCRCLTGLIMHLCKCGV